MKLNIPKNNIDCAIILGCGNLWAIDGNWKLRYPVCMFESPKQTLAFKNNLKYTNTCPNSPKYGMAFCEDHCRIMDANGIPINLKQYKEYSKKPENSTIPVVSVSSAADCQGIAT